MEEDLCDPGREDRNSLLNGWNTIDLSSLPLDVWINHIIPHVALDWLYVNRFWHDVSFARLLSDDRVDPSNGAIVVAAGYSSERVVRLLLADQRVNPTLVPPCHTISEHTLYWMNKAIYNSVLADRVPIVKLLLTPLWIDFLAGPFNILLEAVVRRGNTAMLALFLAHPTVTPLLQNRSQLLVSLAVKNINISTLRLLLSDERVDPATDNLAALRWSAMNGRDMAVTMFLNHCRVDPCCGENDVLVAASRGGHLSTVLLLLSDERIRTKEYFNVAMRTAALHGHADIVELFLYQYNVPPTDFMFYWSARYGHDRVVALLLQDGRVNPSFNDNRAVRKVAKYGCCPVLYLLLQHSLVDPSALNNEAIRCAAERGHVDAVRCLLAHSRVDASASDNLALRKATLGGHESIMLLLLANERVRRHAITGGEREQC